MRNFGGALFVLLSACGEASSPDDGLLDPDSGARDATVADAGADAGTDSSFDGGLADSGAPDADPSDATLDAGLDAALDDASPMDAVVPTDGGLDAGSDGGAVDAGGIADPMLTGPYAVLSAALTATNGNRMVPLDCRYGMGAPAGPLVLVAHGFRVDVAQYDAYTEHLGSHGFVACTVDFADSIVGVNHALWATDLPASIDGALADPTLGIHIDGTRIALTGHSLGGKLSFLAADADNRVDAVIGIDPVDTIPPLCNATNCPDASSLLPFSIPVAVLGETLDSTGAFQACAPTVDNYVTFYDAATAPALEVTVVGAGHMSFVDDFATCGFTCNACQMPVASNADVVALTKSYLVAFLGRHLLGVAAYDDFLTGPTAQQRFVTTGQATLRFR